MYVLLLALSLVAALLWLSHSWLSLKKGLPPGSLGWPLLGQTLHFLASRPSLKDQPFFTKGSSRYGDIFKSHLFGQPFIISTNPEVNKHILENEGVLFQSCQPISAYRRILGKHTLMESHGHLHRKVRAAVVDAISPEKLRTSVFDLIQNIMLEKLPSWQDQFVHVQHEATNWVLSLLMDRLVSQALEDVELLHLQACYNDLKNLLGFPFYLPGSGYRKHIKGWETLVLWLKRKIEIRRTSQSSMSRDILDVLLREEDNGTFTSRSNLILDILIGILFHAEQTTAMAMTLMIKFLSESTEALNQVKEEHAAICKQKDRAEKLSWHDYESMKFTRKVVNESLRLANIVPWVCRVAMQDVMLKGFVVPKGWKVLVFLMGPHLDSTVHKDPEDFNPSRWGDEFSNNVNYAPFGAGLRGCPGEDLAKLILSVFLHHLVTKYGWQLVEEDELICFPVMSFQEGFPIVVKNVTDADECLILH